MSNNTKQCDICKKWVSKLTRRYKGEAYCSSCYSRYFKQRKCPECGRSARLPIDDQNAICTKCVSAQPCIRCGKKHYRIGKITQYGPVCSPCSIYFREPKLCPRCGRVSRRISRAYKYGITEQVCPQCGQPEHGTCPSCRRHRRLCISHTGKNLCKACLEKGNIPCPQCGHLMPAGRANKCETCYYQELLEKRIKINCEAFSSPSLARQFSLFGEWLKNKISPKSAALKINNFLIFFMTIDLKHTDIPSYKILLEIFGAHGLRQNLLPFRWMVETGIISIDEGLKNEFTEKKRIDKQLSTFGKDSTRGKILTKYFKALQNKINLNKLSLRSARLSLTPAIKLLKLTSEIPGQNELYRYLDRSPGQRAAISGFITFLNKKYAPDLILPPVTHKARRKRELKSKQELISLLTEKRIGLMYKQRILGVALNYFHGLPISYGKELFETLSLATEGGVNVLYKNQLYWLPKEFEKHFSN